MAYNHEYPYVDPNRINGDWLLNQVKDFRATLESWEAIINELSEAIKAIPIIDGRLDALEAATEDLTAIRAAINSLDEAIERLTREDTKLWDAIGNITIDYDLVLNQIEELRGLFPKYLKHAKDYTDVKVSELFIDFNVIANELQAQIDELRRLRPEEVINPVRYESVGLQKAYDLAYADMRDDALTNEQLGELGLTNEELADLDFTNLNFALHSRTLLKWDYVFGAISGIKKSVSNALSEVVTFIVGTLSNDQYTALDLTNDDYAALNLTNEQYLLYDPSSRGLTNTEYTNILKSGGSGILRL